MLIESAVYLSLLIEVVMKDRFKKSIIDFQEREINKVVGVKLTLPNVLASVSSLSQTIE